MISREYFFSLVYLNGVRSIVITFLPSSPSCQTFGNNLAVDIIFDDQEMKELIMNYRSIPPKNTHGQVKAKSLSFEKLSEEQSELLMTIGFNTSDVFKIEYA